MAWIRTVKANEAGKGLREAVAALGAAFPPEYASPVEKASSTGESVVESHSLIPDALYHGFKTLSSILSEDLPLERRHHEMIATVVSKTNDCHY